MATLVLISPKVTVNAVNISSSCSRAEINYTAELQDETSFGDTSRARKAGLKDWTVTLEGNQNYATGSLDATMFSLVGASAFKIQLLADTAATAVTNPAYSGHAVLQDYVPVGGAQGEMNRWRGTFLSGDGTDLTRATS